MNNNRVIILIILFSFLVLGLIRIAEVDEAQLEINETKKIEQFLNYDGGEKYKDVIKDLPEIDRVFVRNYSVNRGYSFVEEKVDPFDNFLEDLIQLEARKIDFHEENELLNSDMETVYIAFYEQEQKENGVIYETGTLSMYINDNKYIQIGMNTFEVVDHEALKNLLDEIKKNPKVNI